ncbi:hypothetical protein LguiA_036274 [Lonicera macranthoides]
MSDSLVRVSRRAEWGARRPVPGARRCPKARRDGARCQPRSGRRRLRGHINSPGLAAAPIRTGPRPESIGGPALAVPHPTGAHRRPPSASLPTNFKHSLTLFSKSFSSFPRGTCLLSVSRPYLALDGIYALLGLHSQTTRLADSASWCDRVRARRGSHPLRRPLPGTWARSAAEDASPDYNSDGEAARFSSWAVPGSLAVTRGILVSFFPPLIDMLKLSG